MFKFVVLLFLILYQCCYGYPTKSISGELPEGKEIQNGTNIRTNTKIETSHEIRTPTSSLSEKPKEVSSFDIKIQNMPYTSLRMVDLFSTTLNPTYEQRGVFKKLVKKTKGGIKKVKGIFKKVKAKVDKINKKIDKVKDKIDTAVGIGVLVGKLVG